MSAAPRSPGGSTTPKERDKPRGAVIAWSPQALAWRLTVLALIGAVFGAAIGLAPYAALAVRR